MIAIHASIGQSHDGQADDDLLDHIGAETIVLTDKAYEADRIRAPIRERRAFANIPPKSNRWAKPYFNTCLCRERNLIERFFFKLKHVRQVAPSYDNVPVNFLATVLRASNAAVAVAARLRVCGPETKRPRAPFGTHAAG